jgi:hypothetical protein
MIPSRPLNLGGIIDETIQIIKHTYWRAALIIIIFCGGGIIILQVGINELLNSTEEFFQNFSNISSEAPHLFRDYILTSNGKTNSYSLTRLEYPDIYNVIDSAKEALKAQYPDETSRTALVTQLDSISKIVSKNSVKTIWSSLLDKMLAAIILLTVGFILLLLGIIGSAAAHYDLASRAFEERPLDIPPILRVSLKQTMWKLIAQSITVGFAMLFGMGLVIGISLAISKVFAVIGILVSLIILCYAIVRVMFSPVAMVSEELGPFEGIKRSLELSKDNFWRIVGIYIICSLLIGITGMIIRFPLSLIFSFNTPLLIEYIRSGNTNIRALFGELHSNIFKWELITVVSTLIFASFSPAFITTFYYDLRTRLDGSLEYHDENQNSIEANQHGTSLHPNPSEDFTVN